jgi:hypothetical protein
MSDDNAPFMDDRDLPLIARSDGRRFINWAWGMGAIAAVSLLTTCLIPTTDFMGRYDPSNIAIRANLSIVTAGFVMLWLVLLIAGHIIRAIYFVSGDAMKPCSETMHVQTKQRLRSEHEGRMISVD